jgi:hypothetical protein
MQNLVTANTTSNPARFNQEQRAVLEKIQSLQNRLVQNNVMCQPYSPKALSQLALIDDNKKLQAIINGFQSMEDIMGEEPAPATDLHNLETTYIKRALSQFGMRVDDEFWNILEHGDAVEIYGDDMIQRYRSFNFYNFTSYSILDLVVNEWYVLWERPQSVLTDLIQLANDTISGKKIGPNFINLTHLIRENHDSGATQPFEPRILEVKLKYSMPLYKSVGKTPNGFIVTSSCNVVSVGSDVFNVGFI